MIHIARNGKQEGPYSLEQINELVSSGKLKPGDLSWWEGCDGWVPVSRIPGLAPTSAASSEQSLYAAPRGAIGSVSHGAVSAEAVQALRDTRPWVLFIAILGTIGAIFMILGGLAMLAIGVLGLSAGANAALPGSMMTGMAVMYLVMAVIYVYPVMKLYKYSGAISALSRSGSASDLENALRQQKSFWKFLGIVMALFIVAYLVMIVLFGGAILTGGFGGMSPGGTGFPTLPSP